MSDPKGAHIPRVGRGGRGRLELLLGRRRIEPHGHGIEGKVRGVFTSAAITFVSTATNVTHVRVSLEPFSGNRPEHVYD